MPPTNPLEFRFWLQTEGHGHAKKILLYIRKLTQMAVALDVWR